MKTYAPPNYNCPLCKVAAGKEEAGATLVWRDEMCVGAVALHQQQSTLGSLLLFPTEHYENIYSMPDEIGAHMFKVTKALALGLKQALSCAGVTVRQNNEPAGGQDVWHYHVHIVPRYENESELSSALIVSPVAQRIELAARVRYALSGVV
jgi:histidine triad (HIT) family protein